MTNEEAIDILSYIKTKLDDSASYAEHDVALDMAIKALEQTRWIPVSEGLPKGGQRVLVADKCEAVTTALYFGKSPFWREMVVAWMPLPKPYKGEGEDEK